MPRRQALLTVTEDDETVDDAEDVLPPSVIAAALTPGLTGMALDVDVADEDEDEEEDGDEATGEGAAAACLAANRVTLSE